MKALDHHRTTGQLLQAVSAALLNPNAWIEFQGDVQLSEQSAELWQETIGAICTRLELADIEFRVEQGRLWVRHRVSE